MIYLLFVEEEGLIQKDWTSRWQPRWVLWTKSESEKSGDFWCYTHQHSKEVRGSQIKKWSRWFQSQKGRQVTQAFFKVKTTCKDSADSSHRKVHKLPWGSAGKGLSEPSSKSKQSAQQQNQNLKIHHHQAVRVVMESPQMRRFHQSKKWRNSLHLHPSRKGADLDLHPIPGVNAQSLDLDLTPWSERMINKVDLNLQEEMIDAIIDHSQGAACTLGLMDPHHIWRYLGDHAQRIDDHHTGGENLHLIPQTDGQDPGPDPIVRTGILGIQAVTPLWGGSHLIIINDPTHQNASTGSVYVHMTPGKDIDWIKSRTQFDKRWRWAQ